MRNDEIRIRTTCELSTLGVCIGALLVATCIASLFFVKTFSGVAVMILLPLVYIAAVGFVAVKSKSILMMNVIDPDGVKNSYMGEELCELSWEEIGDFGVAEVENGFFSGRYIYMSRVFVQSSVKNNVVKEYDPRVCVVFPYTAEVCHAITKLSGGRIDIR